MVWLKVLIFIGAVIATYNFLTNIILPLMFSNKNNSSQVSKPENWRDSIDSLSEELKRTNDQTEQELREHKNRNKNNN